MNTSLERFKGNNPTVEIEEDAEHYVIRNMWEDPTFMCRFEKERI